jgi:uncharacterized protein YbjT (DUF2867 family)
MKNVLILGASGAIAQHAIEQLKASNDIHLTLFVRSANRLKGNYNSHTTIIEGDALDTNDLSKAIKNQDIVYANLAGEVDKMASKVVKVMEEVGAKRLIFVTSLGIYDEIPGEFGKWNRRMIGSELVRYRKAADIIEKSKIIYTIVRPSWLTDNDEVEYETTQKGEPFLGTEVARKAVAKYITSVIMDPEKDVNASVGVNKPGAYGDKPAFY